MGINFLLLPSLFIWRASSQGVVSSRPVAPPSWLSEIPTSNELSSPSGPLEWIDELENPLIKTLHVKWQTEKSEFERNKLLDRILMFLEYERDDIENEFKKLPQNDIAAIVAKVFRYREVEVWITLNTDTDSDHCGAEITIHVAEYIEGILEELPEVGCTLTERQIKAIRRWLDIITQSSENWEQNFLKKQDDLVWRHQRIIWLTQFYMGAE